MPRRPLTLIILFALGLFIFITLLNGFSEHPSISPYLSSSSSTCDWGRHDSSSACREASRNAIRHIATQLIGLQSGHKLEHSCTTKAFGSGWGEHSLCDKRPLRVDRPCVFYSFGIDKDYSFDEALSKEWDCRGVLLDPTVAHPARIGTKMNFFSVGATLLNTEDLGGAGASMRGTSTEDWFITSVPSLKKWLKHTHVNVLKMDCEGCEYALARDVAREDPRFFEGVDQLAIEIHISKAWIKSDAHLHYLGLLYHMLEQNEIHLIDASITPCASWDEEPGCPEFLSEIGYPCGKGRMCHNYLFSRTGGAGTPKAGTDE